MNAQRGYSLAELLTVVAIIGVLSLVSIPPFINYARSARIRGATRQFNTDLRAARNRAISRSTPVALSFYPGRTSDSDLEPRRGEYRIYDQGATPTTWTQVGRTRYLDPAVYFRPSDFPLDSAIADEYHDIIFLPNGTIRNIPASGATVVIKSEHNVTNNTVTDEFAASGSFKTQLATDYVD